MVKALHNPYLIDEMGERRMKDTCHSVVHHAVGSRDISSSFGSPPWRAAQSPSMIRSKCYYEILTSQHGWTPISSSTPSLRKRYYHKAPPTLRDQSYRPVSQAQPGPPSFQDRGYHHKHAFPSLKPRYDHTRNPPSIHRSSSPPPMPRRRKHHEDMLYTSARHLSPTSYNAQSDDTLSQMNRDNARRAPSHTWKTEHASTHSGQARPLKPVPKSQMDQRSTCFFWYHGHCSAGARCRKLHALTEPPTNISPPPGYFHLDECTLRSCPLRVGGEPEGLSASEPVTRKLNYSGGDNKRRSRFDLIQNNERRTGQIGNKIEKSKRRSAQCVAKQPCTASRALLTTNLTEREINVHHKRGDDPAQDEPKEGCSNREEEADWFLKGFELDS